MDDSPNSLTFPPTKVFLHTVIDETMGIAQRIVLKFTGVMASALLTVGSYKSTCIMYVLLYQRTVSYVGT